MKIPTMKINVLMIISLSILLLLNGCTLTKPSLYEKTSYSIDLSKYQKEGLFITTGDYYQSYEPLSILTVTCYDGYIKKESSQPSQSSNTKENDALYSTISPSYKMKDYSYQNCSTTDMLDFLFESAQEIKANGIIRLELKPVTQTSPTSGQLQSGILITGLAIKFK
jgi:hypothetical protein